MKKKKRTKKVEKVRDTETTDIENDLIEARKTLLFIDGTNMLKEVFRSGFVTSHLQVFIPAEFLVDPT